MLISITWEEELRIRAAEKATPQYDTNSRNLEENDSLRSTIFHYIESVADQKGIVTKGQGFWNSEPLKHDSWRTSSHQSAWSQTIKNPISAAALDSEQMPGSEATNLYGRSNSRPCK